MRSRQLRAFLRRYGLLLILSPLLGSLLALALAVSVLAPDSVAGEGEAAPAIEGEMIVKVVGEARARALGTEIFRSTSKSVELLWYFPGWEVSDGRAGTLYEVLERSLHRDVALGGRFFRSPLPASHVEVAHSLEVSRLFQVSVWGESEEEIKKSIEELSKYVEELERALFDIDGRRQLIASSIQEAVVALPEVIAEIRELLGGLLETFPRPSLESAGLSELRRSVEAQVSRTIPVDSRLPDLQRGSILTASLSEQLPDTLKVAVRGSSVEDVNHGLQTVAAILESVSVTDQALQYSNRAVIVETPPVRTLRSQVETDYQGPLSILFGAVLGALFALTYSILGLQQSRVLWRTQELFDVAGNIQIVVSSTSLRTNRGSPFNVSDLEVQSLRTFVLSNKTKVIGFTSPKSTLQSEIGSHLAMSIAALSQRVLFINAMNRGDESDGFESGRGKSSVPAAMSDHLVGVDPSSFITEGGADFISLSPEIGRSADFYLSGRWKSGLEWARQNYDYVLVGLGSVLSLEGGLESALGVSSVLVVVRPGETQLKDFAASLKQLENSGVSKLAINVVGVPEKETADWQCILP